MLQYEIKMIVPLGGSDCKVSISVALVLVSEALISGLGNRAIEKQHARDQYPYSKRSRII